MQMQMQERKQPTLKLVTFILFLIAKTYPALAIQLMIIHKYPLFSCDIAPAISANLVVDPATGISTPDTVSSSAFVAMSLSEPSALEMSDQAAMSEERT